ncbi:Nucleotide-diphospho-sugar transferase domain-containing protein [Plasmodiophora brassicae]
MQGARLKRRRFVQAVQRCVRLPPSAYLIIGGLFAVAAVNVVLLGQVLKSPICSAATSRAQEPTSVQKAEPGRRAPRKLWTVMSTQCTPYQDWQVLVAIRSHEMLGFPGPIVRLMACNDDEYEPAASSYDKYSVVRVHDYDTGDDYPDDYFPPRNKANNLRDWLAMDGGPDDDDVIVLIDPDQIFIRHINVGNVVHGHAIASYFVLNENFIDRASRFCGDECLPFTKAEDIMRLHVGPPYIQTAGDFRRHAGLWANLTEMIRSVPELREEFDWLSEMYSYILAALKLGIEHEQLMMMITNGEDPDDPWDLARWFAISKEPLVGLHYCQDYAVGDMSWGKHTYHDFDIRDCNKSAFFPELNDVSLAELRRLRGLPLVDDGTRSKGELDRIRMAWVYDNVVHVANAAIRGYYEEFCAPDAPADPNPGMEEPRESGNDGRDVNLNEAT